MADTFKINAFTPGKRAAFVRAEQQKFNADIIEADFWDAVELVWDYTLCQAVTLYNYYSALRYVVARKLPGDVIECGVALGGSVMFAAEILRRLEPDGVRHLYGLDTFAGFVRHSEGLDVDYAGNPVCLPKENANSFLRAATANIRSVPFDSERLHIVEGDVMETIPRLKSEQISVLRLDTDTYDTTKLELEQLYPRVVRGGVVIIDDYGYALGCKKAVDDFAADKLILPIRVQNHCRAWVKVD